MADRPAGVAGPFVGRARELTAVAAVVADPERTGVALIGGEAGLGKTCLVEEILAAHPEAGVVRGGAVPRGTPLPFELIRTAIDPIARAWVEIPPAITAIGEVAHTVLDHAPASRPGTPTADQIQAAAEVLRNLRPDPTMFVFEDVHWADAESLDVIDRLMVAGPLAATVLVTYRPEVLRPGHPVNAFLQRAERRAHAVQLRLEPLRRDELAQYLARTGFNVDDRTVEHVHSRTGGNPLFLSELVGSADSDRDLTGSLPWTLAELIRPEIDRLAPVGREVAEAVAVLGVDAAFDLVAAAVGVDERELLSRLRDLVNSGILVESAPDRFGFRHELVREAVADGLFTRERRRIHAAAHDALLAAGSDDEVALVAHAAAAGRTKQAADAARDAAVRVLADGSSHQALAFAEQALLVHSDDLGLLKVAVTAGWLTSQSRVALDHVDRWEALVGSDPEARSEVVHWRVRLLWESGDEVGADDAALELVELIDRLGPGTSQAQAYADLAQHRMLSGDPHGAIEAADRAMEVAAAVGAPEVVLQARVERSSAMFQIPNRREEALKELASAVDDAEASGDHLLATRALNNTPVLAAEAGPRRHLERMRSASLRAGMTCVSSTRYRESLLEVAEADGDRSEFEALIDVALGDLGDSLGVLMAAFLAEIGAGRLDEARVLADRLHGLPDSPHFLLVERAGIGALLEFVADGSLEPMRLWLAEQPPGELHLRLALANLAELIDAGLGPEILLMIEKIERSETIGICDHDPMVEALAAELRGELDTADEIYADLIASREAKPVTRLAELELGRARVARATGLDPEPHIRAAAAHLARWPGRLRDHIEAAIGAQEQVTTVDGILTPREREVARLVARGLTNGGIADELFISTKTASVHVSNILAKLTMTSRTEIAAWVASGGLGDSG